MDARAWRSVAVSFVLFGGVGVVFLFGAQALGLGGPQEVEHWLTAARGPWALPVAVAAFAALAFLGVPQFVLIAAAVVAFGPWQGMLYSWIGTWISSLVGFWLGRAFGARLLKDLASRGVDQFMALIGKNGFMASLVVRLVPSAPFIVVNMAAGVTPMRLLDFAAGTGIGIVPKIALTAFAGNSAVRAMSGGGMGHVALLAAAAALWIGAGLVARRWLKARERQASGESED
ncbi:MAG TPA: TVP38/TMEM64 family protein [Caulobacteraceae bacterium]|nr:TVP38/TMEM64 family protein [Caulobacteraceae bacterium]